MSRALDGTVLAKWPRRSLQLLRNSYELASRAAQRLPRRAGYALFALGGAAWYRANPGQRRHALDNYATVLGLEPHDPRVKTVAQAAFANYGKMLLDFVRVGSLTREDVGRLVRPEGIEHLDAALARGCGVILAVPHMGSWDMGCAAIGVHGYPTYAVAEVFPGSLNDAVVETRQRFGVRIIPLDRSAVRRIQAALAENAVVGLLCDIAHGPGVTVQFFGRPAVVPSGPAAFALKTGAALLTAYMYRGGAGTYGARIEPAVDYRPTGDRRNDVRELMQAVMRRFETHISARPDEWYAFRPVFAGAGGA